MKKLISLLILSLASLFLSSCAGGGVTYIPHGGGSPGYHSPRPQGPPPGYYGGGGYNQPRPPMMRPPMQRPPQYGYPRPQPIMRPQYPQYNGGGGYPHQNYGNNYGGNNYSDYRGDSNNYNRNYSRPGVRNPAYRDQFQTTVDSRDSRVSPTNFRGPPPIYYDPNRRY